MGNGNSASSSDSLLKDVLIVSPYLAATVTSELTDNPQIKLRHRYVHEVHF